GESELYFPRSLLFEQGVVALRAVGVEFETSHNGFFTSLAVHNGEAGEVEDHRTWVTAKWGWQDRNKLRLGFSGQTGSTEPTATSSSTATVKLGNADFAQDALWRIGSLFVHWHPSDFQMFLEFHKGEVVQSEVLQGRFVGAHLDLIWQFTERWKVMGRWDQFDLNSKVAGDVQKLATLGVSFSNNTHTSEVFLYASKNIEEVDLPNDELRLQWRLTPLLPSSL
ncbi:MAG: outer membrane beta-barrel protein, partial [Bdellovibrionales bacterium]|nr:outer membrane beta-barrel protein [Bdellovibrionales bacterium]